MGTESMQSISRLFKVLEAMVEKEFSGVRELEEKTKLNVTTIHRLLKSLVDLGYVRQNKETGKYALTYRLVALGNSIMKKNSLVSMIHPHLEKLCEECQETVHFVERVNNKIRYIDKVTPSIGAFAVSSYIGMELPLTSTAVGKSMLAQVSSRELKEAWDEEDRIIYTPNTITDFESLKDELVKVRETGFAYDEEEREIGVRCIAICLSDYQDIKKYAISVSGSIGTVQGEKLKIIEKNLLETKEKLSILLGNL